MLTIFGRFGKPENITNPGFDGTVLRFSVAVVENIHLGTPRELSETRTVRICVEIADSRSSSWNLQGNELQKVLFQFAKEELVKVLGGGTVPKDDLRVTINTATHSGACPFIPALIEEPNFAVIEIEVNQRIGFL